MKKIFLTLLLLIPALFAKAQGPIKMWNDQLDDFIEVYNQIDPTLSQLYNEDGMDAFIFTYFEPEAGFVVKEATIDDKDAFNKVDDKIMNEAKSIALKHLGNAVRTNTRMNNIINEFAKRNTNIVLMYSDEIGPNRNIKQIVITPAEVKAAR